MRSSLAWLSRASHSSDVHTTTMRSDSDQRPQERGAVEEQFLKLNMLTIAASGFLILLTGLLLYVFREPVSRNLRFFLPIPPIGVAAYIFVFNMFRYYEGELPGTVGETLREVGYSTGILTVVFFSFAALSVLLTQLLRRVLSI